ncbi:rhomboid protease ROM6 [Plasmodium gonderi]|uniref:Rhomboid protease ROM6 n=1 Tax=Plasmodium gonderi TaxID=77519 RepID=A0A1Y1JNZ1_PLAGO|nr:rhomboid protease ROM6 [Plasmodium gonderi]GAW82123.1 rhomboid protease ROM6 [Plasmodium gonderi]
MFNVGRCFRVRYYKKYNILRVKTSRQFHEFTKNKKTQTNALKRKDRIKKGKALQFKEKLKLFVFSSLYFFTCDYIYHVYVLSDRHSANNANRRNNNEKAENYQTNEHDHAEDRGVGMGKTLMNYINWMNIFETSKGKDKENIKHENGNKHMGGNEIQEIKVQKGSQRKDKFSGNKEEIKICSVCDDDDPYEIKINRVKRSAWDQENSKDDGKESEKKEQIYGYSMSSNGQNRDNNRRIGEGGTAQRNSIGGEEKNMKDLIVSNIYKNDVFNWCNLFLFVNGIVFLSWRLSEIVENKRFFYFMCRNFICSYENVKRKYYHTMFTASISHITLPHFLFNMWAFHTISNTLLSPEIKENKKNYYFFFNYKSSVLEKKMTDNDIMKVCFLSSIISTLPYIFLHKRNQLLGASGAVMGLVYILSTVKPNEVFVSLFPLPYVKMTALQLCHLSILTNFVFLFLKRNHFSIAWSAHLFGLMGGAIYNIYQRKQNNNKNYYPFIQLSIKNGSIDYLNSYLDFLDFVKCLQLQIRIFFSFDPRSMQNMNRQITSIKHMQSQRRLKYHMLKVKNLEAMSK